MSANATTHSQDRPTHVRKDTNTCVLLVEDNTVDAFLVQQALSEFPIPVRLCVARDGEQALQMLSEPDFEPDLIILDLNIPKISGFSVLASYPPKKTPVVVFTASSCDADLNRAFRLGALDCIRKPMDLDEFKIAVCCMVHKWRHEKGRE